MNKKIIDNEINNAEILAFIKCWLYNTNEILKLGNSEVEVSNKEMISFYREFLKSFLKNKNHYKIVGCDKIRDFEICLADKDILLKTAKDIWKNPHKYYKLDKDEDSYYDFLKFLWIEGLGDGVRLTDIIDAND